MADQRVSNERKKELEQLDPFQAKMIKAIEYVKRYKKQLGLIAGAVVLIAVIFSGVMYSFKKSENVASELLSQAMITYAETDDPKKGFEQAKEDFAVIFKDYANTSAGRLARVEYAKICFTASEFEESLKHYKEALDLFKNEALMENFILVSMGHISAAKKDETSARKYFQQVKNSKTDLLKDEALFALAVMDELNGNTTESRQYFERIVSDYGDSIYFPVAKSKIAETESGNRQLQMLKAGK